MLEEQIEADVVSYGSILHACGAQGQWERALVLFQELRPSAAGVSLLVTAMPRRCQRLFRPFKGL